MADPLDDPRRLVRVDRAQMMGLVLGLPQQCRDAFRWGESLPVPPRARRVERILLSGMGGSAIGGDVLAAYLADRLTVPLLVNRAYTLPRFAARGTLHLISSYSGNTEETLSSFQASLPHRLPTIVLTSGGRLAEQARRHRLNCHLIPPHLPPRSALGWMTMPWLALLRRLRLIPAQRAAVQEAVRVISRLRDTAWGPQVPCRRNLAKQLAHACHRRVTILYASHRYGVAAARFRAQLAENAKALAFHHTFPEANHNELVGWVQPVPFLRQAHVIMLQAPDDHPRVALQMSVAREVLRGLRVAVREVTAEGRGFLARLLSLVFLGDLVSVYLAVLYREDPTPVERIRRLKARLASSKA